MPGFSLGGISHTQSPTGTTFIGNAGSFGIAADVDDDARVPAGRARLEAELVQRHRLGVRTQDRVRAVDTPANDARVERGRRHPNADLGPREDELLAVLEEDQLGEPVVEQQVQRARLEPDGALRVPGQRPRIDHDVGERVGRGREEVAEVAAIDLQRAVRDRNGLEDLPGPHDHGMCAAGSSFVAGSTRV